MIVKCVLSWTVHAAVAYAATLGTYLGTGDPKFLFLACFSSCLFGLWWEWGIQRAVAKGIKWLWRRGLWFWKLWEPQPSPVEFTGWVFGAITGVVVAWFSRS